MAYTFMVVEDGWKVICITRIRNLSLYLINIHVCPCTFFICFTSSKDSVTGQNATSTSLSKPMKSMEEMIWRVYQRKQKEKHQKRFVENFLIPFVSVFHDKIMLFSFYNCNFTSVIRRPLYTESLMEKICFQSIRFACSNLCLTFVPYLCSGNGVFQCILGTMQ